LKYLPHRFEIYYITLTFQLHNVSEQQFSFYF
jgi:hypothetical protein